jgi:hypothetical protein
MSRPDRQRNDVQPVSLHELLLRLDLATETLEGLDELGVDNRADLEQLLSRIERQIADAEERVVDASTRERRGSL